MGRRGGAREIHTLLLIVGGGDSGGYWALFRFEL